MTNKTLYVRDCDAEIWGRAEVVAAKRRISVSQLVADGLRMLLDPQAVSNHDIASGRAVRMNISVPAGLAEHVRSAGLPVSSICQKALASASGGDALSPAAIAVIESVVRKVVAEHVGTHPNGGATPDAIPKPH